MCELEQTLHDYCEAAHGTGECFDDPAKANRCARELYTHYIALRQTQLGRDAIASLMNHENPNIRLWAAAHSLEWAPAMATAILEELRDSDGPASFDAKWTLKEYKRKGRLSVLPLLEPEFSCARVSIARGEPDVPETTQAV